MGKPITNPVPLTRPGQRFYDEPIYDHLRAKPLAVAVTAALGGRPSQSINALVGYERTRLRWVKPGKE